MKAKLALVKSSHTSLNVVKDAHIDADFEEILAKQKTNKSPTKQLTMLS